MLLCYFAKYPRSAGGYARVLQRLTPMHEFAASFTSMRWWAPLQVRWMMEADGYRPQGSVWGSLITACGKAGQLGSAEALWLEMQAVGVAPTEHHYQALMNACVWTFQVLSPSVCASLS